MRDLKAAETESFTRFDLGLRVRIRFDAANTKLGFGARRRN
jgi:hypothetical protein